jgi:hypothetical protein
MYRILAERSAASMFGAASAHLKSNGEVLKFATHAEAEQYLKTWLANPPRNLTYTVVEVKE